MKRRGQALVEFALVGTTLAILLAIVADFGRIFYYDVATWGAVREGGRAAIDTTKTDADITAAVRRAAPGVTLASVSVSPSGSRDPDHCSTCSGSNVVVTATFTISVITPVVQAVLGSTHTYSRSVTTKMI